MNKRIGLILFLMSVALAAASLSTIADTTIDGTNRFAYGANIGWMDWTGDTNNGAVIGEYVCSGYIYSANVGWINLGGGAPTNGVYYQNNSPGDFGVNQDGLGNLSGYAYGANIGWIAFGTNGAPKVNLVTGSMSGNVWSANCGWISLTNTMAYVRTDTVQPGTDSNHNGIPDAWEYQNFGALVSASADPDHDGQSNLEEYLAGTDPNNAGDFLRITSLRRSFGTTTVLAWTANPYRYYNVEIRTTLSTNSPWSPSLLGTSGFGVSNSTIAAFSPTYFYRIRASRPLMP